MLQKLSGNGLNILEDEKFGYVFTALLLYTSKMSLK